MSTETTEDGRKLTGWHALGIFGGCFAVIIGVNIALAWNAVATFPGVETHNSYIASQTFDDRRAAQEALGWDVHARHQDGLLTLSITGNDGNPVQAGTVKATLGRPTHVLDDREPDFAFDGRAYVARETLAPGNWDLWLEITALDGTEFTQRLQVEVLH